MSAITVLVSVTGKLVESPPPACETPWLRPSELATIALSTTVRLGGDAVASDHGVADCRDPVDLEPAAIGIRECRGPGGNARRHVVVTDGAVAEQQLVLDEDSPAAAILAGELRERLHPRRLPLQTAIG